MSFFHLFSLLLHCNSGRLAEWPNALDSKSGIRFPRIGGLNPSSSASWVSVIVVGACLLQRFSILKAFDCEQSISEIGDIGTCSNPLIHPFTCQQSTIMWADARAVRPYMHSIELQRLIPRVPISAILSCNMAEISVQYGWYCTLI